LEKPDNQCTKYNFQPIDSNVKQIRLRIYDFFLIAESRETLTEVKKPFYLKDNWAKFAKYRDKIRRIEVELVRNTTDPWSNEHRMRWRSSSSFIDYQRVNIYIF
jgi:hypothetical protein